MAAASAVASSSSSPALEPHPDLSPVFSSPSAASSSSSSSRDEGARGVSCEGGGGDDVFDLDAPWVAAAEAESRLEEAVTVAAAARVGLCCTEEKGKGKGEKEEDEIRNNRQRQEDEVWYTDLLIGSGNFNNLLILVCALVNFLAMGLLYS